MTRSPTFSPAAETTTPPRTSGSAAPRPSPPGPTSPASPWRHNHAYRRASLSPSRFPSICRSQVDGAVSDCNMTEFAPSGSSAHSLGALQLLERAACFDEEQDTGIGQSDCGPLASGQQSGAQL